MKSIMIVAATLTAASIASAENYNDFGNIVGSHGEVTIKNADSSYEVGDVIFKKGITKDFTSKDGTHYREYDGIVVETNIDKHTLDFATFDKVGNAVIDHRTPYTKPEDRPITE